MTKRRFFCKKVAKICVNGFFFVTLPPNLCIRLQKDCEEVYSYSVMCSRMRLYECTDRALAGDSLFHCFEW